MTIDEFENRFLQLPSPIVEIKSDLFSLKNISVYVKRDDLIHPEISGNNVVWRGFDENSNELYLYNKITTVPLANNNMNNFYKMK